MSTLCAPLPFLFSSLLLSTLRLTLFPYTTLFRSVVITMKVSKQDRPALRAIHGLQRLVQRLVGPCLASVGQVLDPGDRKSTRLNSSHVAISYAVFCLKKKSAVHGRTSRRHAAVCN